MLRVVFSRRWLLRHLVVVLGLLALSLLGRWQWDKAMGPTGTLQNLVYGIQWWVFAAVLVFGWWKTIREDLKPLRGKPVDERPPTQVLVAPPPAPVDEEADDELAAYNRYLAALNARSRQVH